MLISKDVRIDYENINLDKGDLETDLNSVGPPTSILYRFCAEAPSEAYLSLKELILHPA